MKIEIQDRFGAGVSDTFTEIERQDKKFGEGRDNHPLVWLSILTEEIGEMAKEINEADFQTRNLSDNYRNEWVQIVAVGLQAILHFDRFKKGEFNPKKATKDFLLKLGFTLDKNERFVKEFNDGIFQELRIFAETINDEVVAVSISVGNDKERILSDIEDESQIRKLIEALQAI